MPQSSSFTAAGKRYLGSYESTARLPDPSSVPVGTTASVGDAHYQSAGATWITAVETSTTTANAVVTGNSTVGENLSVTGNAAVTGSLSTTGPIYVPDVNIYGAITAVALPAASYANDGAAATGGVPVGGLYHTAGAVKVRLT